MAIKSVTQAVDDRKAKGAKIVATPNAVAQVSHSAFLVAGSEGSDYHVSLHILESASCDCPDFKRNGTALGTCKHIVAAQMFLEQANAAEQSAAMPSPLYALAEVAVAA